MPLAKKGAAMPVDKILSLRRNPQQLQREMEDRPSFLPRQLRAESPGAKTQESQQTYRKDTAADGSDADLHRLPPPRRSQVSRQNLQRYRRTPEYYMNMLKMMSIVLTVCLLFAFVPYYRKCQGGGGHKPSSNHTVILLWNEGPAWERSVHMECGCLVTSDRHFHGEPFEAIVINADRAYTQQGLDAIQHTSDHLVVFSGSAPLSLTQDPMPHLKSPFNLTMSYRLDSDLVWSEYYFSLHNQSSRLNVFAPPIEDISNHMSTPLILGLHEQLKRKDRLAVYLMYEVNEYTMPESYYLMEMRKHVELEAHESCLGYHDCSAYHFMLIFEPSSCPDYVHPQFYQALDKFMVPVLIGGGNLTNLVPPGSYISSRDFATAKHLVKHLKALMDQPVLYQRFFWWHSNYKLRATLEPYCQLCHLLKQRHQPQAQLQLQPLNPQEVPQEQTTAAAEAVPIPVPVPVAVPIPFVDWWQRYHCPNRQTRF
ncbi:alpha-(1,3)-fucosyltransferase C [Drosophila obscura]|uniref:alpha-(1,3)-fucosyltransferase C n=1 Tax=Drosophila obscura TaxID=7282 RepID=UPI001BB126F3|nr:alpha-(1,3)-fucosyltransferase C [Drosophila obscura]